MLLKMPCSKCHTHSDFFVGLPTARVYGSGRPLVSSLEQRPSWNQAGFAARPVCAALYWRVEWIMHLRDANRLAGPPPQWVCVLIEAA